MNPTMMLFLAQTAMNVFGGIQEDKAIQAQGEAQEDALRFNAAQNLKAAFTTRRKGAEAEYLVRKELRKQLAENRVRSAGAGAIATGSPLDAELLMLKENAASLAIMHESSELAAQKLETLAQFQYKQAHDVGEATEDARKGNILDRIGGFVGSLGDLF